MPRAVRVATCRAVARPDAAAAAAELAGPRAHVAHDLLRPVWRVGAGRSAVAAPSQRRRGVPRWPAPAAARRPVTDVTAAAPSCRRPARLAPPTAASEACAERSERARRPARTPGVRPAGAIFTPRDGAISPARDWSGSERPAAPRRFRAGWAPAWRWSTVAPGPAGVAAARAPSLYGNE